MMEQERPAKPWDLFNANLGRVETVIAKQRLDICKSCPHLVRFTHQCLKCGCLMDLKVKLPNASCPIGQWGAVRVTTEGVLDV